MEHIWDCEKYECNIQNAKEILEKYGVAIIKNVLDENEIKDMRSGMWDF